MAKTHGMPQYVDKKWAFFVHLLAVKKDSNKGLNCDSCLVKSPSYLVIMLEGQTNTSVFFLAAEFPIFSGKIILLLVW